VKVAVSAQPLTVLLVVMVAPVVVVSRRMAIGPLEVLGLHLKAMMAEMVFLVQPQVSVAAVAAEVRGVLVQTH
jgi:hypothetical protein